MDLRSIEKIIDDPFLTPVACFHAQHCVDGNIPIVAFQGDEQVVQRALQDLDDHPDRL
jgi:hypothetical protein